MPQKSDLLRSPQSEAPRLWVVTECYPKPWAVHHCAFAHRQLAGLVQAGWQVQVLVPNGWHPPVLWHTAAAWRQTKAQQIPDGWSLDGVQVASLVYQNRVPSRLCRPTDALGRITMALTKYLAQQNLRSERDILLAQFALPYGPAAQQAAHAMGIPYGVYLRGDDVWIDPHKDGGKRLAGFVACLRRADLVLAVAQALLDEAARITGTTFARQAAIPNGIDLTLFRPPRDTTERQHLRAGFGLAEDEITIVCVGDTIERKGWRELIAALGRPALAQYRLALLAATGKASSALDLTAEMKLHAPHVRLLDQGRVKVAQVADIYRAGDIFCLVSHWEGLANALLEALASGLPVVTTNIAGHPEVVTPGVEGLLVPPRDVTATADALAQLIATPELRRACGGAARRRAESIGTSQENGQRLAQVLDGLRQPVPFQPSNAPRDNEQCVA